MAWNFLDNLGQLKTTDAGDDAATLTAAALDVDLSTLADGPITWTTTGTMTVDSPQQLTGGTGAWGGAQGYSSESYTDGCFVQFKKADATHSVMMGLNSDPATDANYTSLDYTFQTTATGFVTVYEGGVLQASVGSYDATTVFTIIYDGVNVTYYVDGVEVWQTARAIGAALYLDSAFLQAGGTATAIRFGEFPGELVSRDYVDATAGKTVRSVSASGNVLTTDYYLLLLTTTAAGAFTMTLPAVSGNSGMQILMVDTEGNANNKSVTVAVQSGEYLDDVLNGTYVINVPREKIGLLCNGSRWYLV